MEPIWLKIIGNKSNPLLWPMILILWLLSLLYRIGLWLRNRIISASVKTTAPVISIGNLTVGGTGKTPVTVAVSRHFLKRNFKVGVVCSGYGRKIKRDIIASGQEISTLDTESTGDELMLLAESLPKALFAVSDSKSKSAANLDRRFSPDVIIVDDGFQHRRLHRRIDILLIDATRDLRKESIFPLGRLREPLGAAARADRILLTKINLASNNVSYVDWCMKNYAAQQPLNIEFINDSMVSGNEAVSIKSLSGEKCFFLAGLADFDGLFNSMKKTGLNVAGYRRFPDHHLYRNKDIDSLKGELEKTEPEYIITTRKDYVKLRDFDFGRRLYYLDLRLEFGEAGRTFFEWLDSSVSKR